MLNKNLSDSSDALISLVEVIKRCYCPVKVSIKRGRKADFSDLSFLLLAVVAVVTKTFSDSELHRLLLHDSQLLKTLEFCRVPHRTTILRRLKSLIPKTEKQISLLGKKILLEVKLAENISCISSTDGRMYEASGPLWHKKDRLKNQIPQGLRNVDTQSSWSRSAYRGWVQGCRLIIQSLVFPMPTPIFAVWRENSRNEAEILLKELEKNSFQVTEVNLGDERLADLELPKKYKEKGGYLMTSKEFSNKRKTWKNDVYQYRKETIELLFQRIIQAFDLKKCKVKGLGKNGTFVLATVWCYQICFLTNYRKQRPLAVIKEHIEKARWRIRI